METIYILFKNYIISPLNLLIVSIYYVLIDINDKNHNDNICTDIRLKVITMRKPNFVTTIPSHPYSFNILFLFLNYK